MRHVSGSIEGTGPWARPRRVRALDFAAVRILRLPRGHHDYTVTRAVRVPMRDGVDLLADIYAPFGKSPGTLLIRTPYGRTGTVALLTARYYATHGYLVVNQSCRGTAGSGGDFKPFSNDIDDGADTVAWLRTQAWFGGRFALCGASYLGATAWALMTDPPPELAAAVITTSAHDTHWVTHGAGAFALEGTLSLLDGLDHLESGAVAGLLRLVTASRRLRPAFEELPLTRAGETVLGAGGQTYREWLTAPNAQDPLWRPMRMGRAMDNVNVPVLLLEGWQDQFVAQMLEEYEHLRRRGVDVGLTIGPWTHVQTATRGAPILIGETLDWLGEHLAGASRRQRPSPVHIFVTGAGWRHLPTWPPHTKEQVLYLLPGGGLGHSPPGANSPPSTFRFDPADPTPAVGGRVINPARAGSRDNRTLEERDDVLTFTSPPMGEPLEVLGHPVMELVHHTDNRCADLFVRICEVNANGRSLNLSDGFQRLSPEKSSGTIIIPLDAMAHRFNPGTRIRVQVSGGAHPRYARNLGTQEDPATGTKLVPSGRMICHGVGGFSRVLLPVSATNGG